MNTPKQGAFTSKLKKLSKDLETVESEYLGSNREKFDLFKNREFLDEFNEVILKIGKCLAEQVKFSVDESADEDAKILSGGKKKSDSKPLLEKAAKELIKTRKVFNTQIKELEIDNLNVRKIKWHQLKASLEFSRKALLKLSEAKVKSRFAVLNSKTVKTEIKGLADSLFDIFNSFKNKYEAKPEEAMKKELIENIQKIRDDALEECKNKYHININELNKYSFLNKIETHYGVYLNFQNENYEEKFEKLVKAEGPEKALKKFQLIKSNLRSLITEKMRHKYDADVERFVDWFVEDLLDFVNSDNKYYRELKSSKLVCTYRSKILYKKGLFSKAADDFLKKAYGIMTKKLEEKIKSDETLRKKVTNILMKVRDLDELDRKLKNILD